LTHPQNEQEELKMDYRRFGNRIVARIDRGEEIHEQLKEIALRESIKLAEVSALGAVDDFTVGVYKVAEKKYYANSFQGPFEIVSLTGTITTMNGEYYAHLHMSAGNERGEVFGGHLNRAMVSATCEMTISVIDGAVERRFDPDVGLNLFEFG
jgi:Predicted DNA-binding protein with PD1-like DNA-binding motif